MMGYTKTKRLLNLLTAAAVAATSLSAPFSVSAADNAEVGSGAEETQATVSAVDRKAVELGFCDFDGKNNCIGGGSSVKIDDEHKNSIAVPNAGAIGLTFPKKINSGKVIISYDVYFDNLAGHVFRTYTDENATGSEFENIVVQSDGNMYIAKGNAWIVNNVPFRAYETKKWHSVELTYDFDARKYKLALDGEFIGQEDMKSTLTQIHSFRLLPISDGIKVDNMGAVYIPTDGIIDMSQYPYIDYYEEELDNGIQPWIQTGQVGDAYFGKDMDFKLKLVNNNSTASKGKIKMTYMNADGVSEVTEADYQIDGYGVETLDLSMKTECYGMGELTAEVIEDGGVLVGTSSKDVAVSAPGRFNAKIGLNDHLSRPSMGFDQFEMLVKAGCGVYRDGLDTTALVKSSGQVGNTEPSIDRFIELAEQNPDVRYTIDLYTGGPYSGWDYYIPIGKDQMDTWLIYVKEALKMCKNIKNLDFEIGNEYNYPMQWNPEKYTTELYYEVCKATYPVIKAERPDANMYVFVSAANNETDRFLKEGLEMGIADYADGFSIHPYDVFHSGENSVAKEKVEHYHKIFEDAGHGDMPVIYTEYGWSVCGATGVDLQEKARWYPQSAMLYTDTAEYIEYYNLMNKNDAGEFESNFGLVENFMKEVPYKPTPALLTLSNYNRVMANTGNLDKRDYADGNSTVCLVDNEYGTKSVMAWMKEDKPDTKVALNVGADKVVVGDMYGNEKEVVTENGILNITLRQDPMYITGDIHDVSEAETNIYVNESTLDLVEGDTGHITGKLPDNTYSVEVVCPDNLKADAAEIKSDGNFAVKLNVGKKGIEGEKIRVNIKKGEDIVYTGYTEVNYTKLAEVSSTIVYTEIRIGSLSLRLKTVQIHFL